MKKVFLVLGALMTLSATTTMAADSRTVTIGDKKVLITDTKLRTSPDLVKIHTDSIKRGVYVNVQESLVASLYLTPFPHSNKFVRELLEARGIKTVDQPADADISISFGVLSTAMNMNDIEQQTSDYKSRISSGAIIGMAAGGAGLYALAAGALGSFYQNDKDIAIHGQVYRNPIVKKNWISSSTDTAYRYTKTVFYRMPEQKEEIPNAEEMFKMLVNEWIDAYFVIDNTPQSDAAGAAASSVTSVTAASNKM